MSYKRVFIILLGLSCLGTLSANAQCKLIDGEQGAVFLTFEMTALVKVDGKEKPVKGAIFQLHNNSNCSVILTTGDVSKFYKPLPPNPTPIQIIRREVDWILPDGVLVPDLQYTYQTINSWGKSVSGDRFFGFELLGGRFVRFEVPFTHLDPSFANKIAVEFDYTWEADNAARIKRSQVTNTVRYWIGSLPEEVKKDIAKSLR
jgi:hypothetical protein